MLVTEYALYIGMHLEHVFLRSVCYAAARIAEWVVGILIPPVLKTSTCQFPSTSSASSADIRSC